MASGVRSTKATSIPTQSGAMTSTAPFTCSRRSASCRFRLGESLRSAANGISATPGSRHRRSDRLDRVLYAIRTARRSRRIALKSVLIGIRVSFARMEAAALGCLTPVQGALMQEVIDVAAILNALRALTGGRDAG